MKENSLIALSRREIMTLLMNINPAVLRKHRQWPLVKEIHQKLSEKGFHCYLAGGCVRDMLIGKMPSDLDLASSAAPIDIEKLFEKTIDVGREFGTMVIVKNGEQVEVTRFRRDGFYKDGRHPEQIEFCDEREDAFRRDFTINAMFYDLNTHKVIDYVGGQRDIKRKVLRTVGNASERFAEDKLRVMRALRFHAQLGFSVESKTLQAICDWAPRILEVSRERILYELRKMCSGDWAFSAMELMMNTRLWVHMWGVPSFKRELPKQGEFDSLGVHTFVAVCSFMHLWHLQNNQWNWLEATKGWPFTKKERRELNEVLHVFEILQSSESEFKKLLALESQQSLISLNLYYYWMGSDLAIEKLTHKFTQLCNTKGELPQRWVEAKDLLARGVPRSPEIKHLLNKAYEIQLLGSLNSKEEILNELDL